MAPYVPRRCVWLWLRLQYVQYSMCELGYQKGFTVYNATYMYMYGVSARSDVIKSKVKVQAWNDRRALRGAGAGAVPPVWVGVSGGKGGGVSAGTGPQRSAGRSSRGGAGARERRRGKKMVTRRGGAVR